MAFLTQVRHDLAADEAGSANDNDLHDFFSIRQNDGWRMIDRAWEDFVVPSKSPCILVQKVPDVA
jgi:hypothetical protein